MGAPNGFLPAICRWIEASAAGYRAAGRLNVNNFWHEACRARSAADWSRTAPSQDPCGRRSCRRLGPPLAVVSLHRFGAPIVPIAPIGPAKSGKGLQIWNGHRETTDADG